MELFQCCFVLQLNAYSEPLSVFTEEYDTHLAWYSVVWHAFHHRPAGAISQGENRS